MDPGHLCLLPTESLIVGLSHLLSRGDSVAARNPVTESPPVLCGASIYSEASGIKQGNLYTTLLARYPSKIFKSLSLPDVP